MTRVFTGCSSTTRVFSFRYSADDGGWLLYGKSEQIHGQTHTSTDANASTSSYHEATATGFNVPYAPFAEAFGSLFEIMISTLRFFARFSAVVFGTMGRYEA